MFEHAQQYYDNPTMEAGTTAVEKWKNDIETAEKKCQFDVKAMDIYAAKLTTDKEKNAEPAVGTSASALHQWMELSLAIEEKQ